MALKKKRKLKFNLVHTLVVLLIIIAGIGGYFFNQIFVSNNYEKKLSEAQEKLDQSTRNAFVLKAAVKKGDVITADMVTPSTILQESANGNYLSIDDLDATALVDIDAEIPLTDRMVSKEVISKDMREEEFTTVTLMTNLEENDYVDIRILFPSGEDYIVMSKKKVKDLTLGANSFYAWLNEEEILRMSSAIIDAYLHPGAKLYTVKYVESSLQDESEPTYPVRQEVMDILKNDHNVLTLAEKTLSQKAREDLDNRLNSIDETSEDAVEQGLSKEDEVRNSILHSGSTDSANSGMPTEEGTIDYQEGATE